MVWLVTRASKNEVEELEELEKQKESFYGLERHKMERFQAQVENFVVDCQMQVQELRNKINEVNDVSLSSFGICFSGLYIEFVMLLLMRAKHVIW